MKITLNNPKEITVTSAKIKTISSITIIEITDSPTRKTVVAQTQELGMIRLWKDDEYDAIGQWTDTNVIDCITQLYNL